MARMPRLNVELSEDLHRRVKAGAALAGLNLTDYITAVLEGELPLPPRELPPPPSRRPGR